MPPDREANDQTKTPEPERTPAYLNGFGPNTERLNHLLNFYQKAVENGPAELKTLSAGLAGLSGTGGERADKIRTIIDELVKQVTNLTGSVLIVHEMMAVLFVTIVEAYLKDVLIYAAGIDASLMDRSEQTLTYREALNTKSLEEVLIEFRSEGQANSSIMAVQPLGLKISGESARGAIVPKRLPKWKRYGASDISLFIPQALLTRSSFAVTRNSKLKWANDSPLIADT